MTQAPATPPAGWYPDPGGSGDQRWWDGQGWTERTQPPSLFSDTRAWLARSPKARTVGRLVACAAATCATGALIIDAAALIRGKPLNGIAVLLVPAIPTLVVGQLWAIGVLQTRMGRRTGGRGDRMRASQAMSWNPRSFFFGDLPSRFARPLLALAFLGWLSAVTAFPAFTNGGPAGSGGGCAYRLNSHGSFTCVSLRTYEHAGAGEQRFASGVLLGFFAIHTGAALGGLRTRRRDALS